MGTSVGTIDLDLALQSDSFRKQLQQTVNRAVRNTNQQLGSVGNTGSVLSGAFGKLGKVIAGAFAVSKITAFGKECLSLGAYPAAWTSLPRMPPNSSACRKLWRRSTPELTALWRRHSALHKSRHWICLRL